MAIKINEQLIVSHETEFAVRFDAQTDWDGRVIAEPVEVACSDEIEAIVTQRMAGGTRVSREVYRTDWAEVDE